MSGIQLIFRFILNFKHFLIYIWIYALKSKCFRICLSNQRRLSEKSNCLNILILNNVWSMFKEYFEQADRLNCDSNFGKLRDFYVNFKIKNHKKSFNHFWKKNIRKKLSKQIKFFKYSRFNPSVLFFKAQTIFWIF